MKVNGEYLCELVRAHYDEDEERFETILNQIIDSQVRKGNMEVADRLQSIYDEWEPG